MSPLESSRKRVLGSVPEPAYGNRVPGKLKFYTIEQVAEIFGLSTRSVRRLIDDRKLPVHRFGGSVRIAEADLRAFIAVHRID